MTTISAVLKFKHASYSTAFLISLHKLEIKHSIQPTSCAIFIYYLVNIDSLSFDHDIIFT